MKQRAVVAGVLSNPFRYIEPGQEFELDEQMVWAVEVIAEVIPEPAPEPAPKRKKAAAAPAEPEAPAVPPEEDPPI